MWGSTPSTAAYNFDHYFAKGSAPLWNDMGNGNWATAPNYATVVLAVYNRMLTASGLPGQCPPDGLLFGPLTDAGPCPVSLRQPGRAIAGLQTGGYYVLNGNGTVGAFNGAPSFGSPPLAGSDIFRDIAAMPDGQGYVVLAGNGLVYKLGSATNPSLLGNVSMPYYPGQDTARSIAVMPDGKGYVVLNGDGAITKWGSAAAGPMAALGNPSWPGYDLGRSIAIMPDGAGYLVLDSYGGVNKYGSATHGAVGSGSTPYWGVDLGRDLVLGPRRSATTWSTRGAASSTRRASRPAPTPRPRCSAIAGAASRCATGSRCCSATTARPPCRADVGTSAIQHHHGAQHLAPFHLVERVLDRLERDGLAHEAVEVETARQREVDQHREVA